MNTAHFYLELYVDYSDEVSEHEITEAVRAALRDPNVLTLVDAIDPDNALGVEIFLEIAS